MRKDAEVVSVDVMARIEAVATRLFIAHGYNGVSYLDIGRELGITHSGIHYYYRTKAVLADAVLRRVAEDTLGAMKGIWADPKTPYFDKFVGTRDWTYAQYLLFNPGGKGGRAWGLLSRFTLEADALTSAIRRSIRHSVDQIEEHIATGVGAAVRNRELEADAPQDGITLQIASLISMTGQATRHASGFARLDDLLRWTYFGIERAYGTSSRRKKHWPDLPRPPPDIAARRSAQRPAATGA